MLHPPPAEGWHSRLGGTAGEPSSRFHPYLNCRPDPRTLPGVGTSVYRSSSCALMDSAASRVSQGEPSAGASQGNRERGQCQLRFGDCPTLGQALLCPGSCCLLSRRPECVLLLLPFLLGLRRGAPGSFKGQGDHCSVGTVPQEHPSHGGMSPGAVAGPSWPMGLLSLELFLKLLFKREFPGSLFTAAIYL